MNWTNYEKNIVVALYKDGKSLEEIAEIINKIARPIRMDNGTFTIHRTPRAVLFQLHNRGIITEEEFSKIEAEFKERYEKDKKETGRLRSKLLEKVRDLVLERDNNRCIFCGSKEHLHMAHLVSFKISKKNLEKEAIILCLKCHGLFDERSKESTNEKRKEMGRFIWNIMCSYYPEYPKDYLYKEGFCMNCKKLHIRFIEKTRSSPS